MKRTQGSSPRDYEPKPIDTHGVRLSPRLDPLIKRLAENAHDVWATQRFEQGWTWGESRDDTRKQTPCLVPYRELSEVEKSVDRALAVSTLKAIIALGYEIGRPGSRRSRASERGPEQEKLNQVLARADKGTVVLDELRDLWESRDRVLWADLREVYAALAECLVRTGESLWAYDVTSEGLLVSPGHLRLQQLQALALARSGAPLAAQNVLNALVAQGHTDGETLGLLARTHKDLARRAVDPGQARQALQRAYVCYLQGYTDSGGYYPGANAASLALLLGDRDQACALATKVRVECMVLTTGGECSHWVDATLGECALILGDLGAATRHYAQAVQRVGNNVAETATMRRQARLILGCRGLDSTSLDACFRIPPVAVFSGSVPPVYGATVKVPSQTAEKRLKARLFALMQEAGFRIVYSALVTPQDLCFAETALTLGAELHLVLPCALQDTVGLICGKTASAVRRQRVAAVVARAASLTYASRDPYAGSATQIVFPRQLAQGLAALRCRSLEVELNWIAVLQDLPQLSTAPVALPDVAGSGDAPTVPQPSRSGRRHTQTKPTQQIRAILFADVVDYSKLRETEIPLYIKHFLGQVAHLLESTPHQPEIRNTWGDAFYFVFTDVPTAGRFALEFQELILGTDWKRLGFAKDLSIRAALHAGPVFLIRDPVLNQSSYTGSHVSCTARIEPITEEGQIYASEAFAALATAAGVRDFDCEYVGTRPLAKRYGEMRVFLVKRAPRAPQPPHDEWTQSPTRSAPRPHADGG